MRERIEFTEISWQRFPEFDRGSARHIHILARGPNGRMFEIWTWLTDALLADHTACDEISRHELESTYRRLLRQEQAA